LTWDIRFFLFSGLLSTFEPVQNMSKLRLAVNFLSQIFFRRLKMTVWDKSQKMAFKGFSRLYWNLLLVKCRRNDEILSN